MQNVKGKRQNIKCKGGCMVLLMDKQTFAAPFTFNKNTSSATPNIHTCF
jgi:hypothetical protein